MGYFTNKRNVTIWEISKVLGISKSTTHRHLRDAISKLVERYIEEIY